MLAETCCRKHNKGKESGELMIEGMVVVSMTMLILVWLLSLGFLYYQRTVVTVIVNDAAVKVASTYRNPASDIVMGFTTKEDIKNKELYRNVSLKMLNANKNRVEAYVKYMIDKSSLNGMRDNIVVSMSLENDSLYRKHIKVTATCQYNTPFSKGLSLFGLTGKNKYKVEAYADCTDIAEYISVTEYATAWGKGTFVSGSGIVDSTVKMINSIINLFSK